MNTVKKAPVPSGPTAFVSYKESVLDVLDQQTPRIPSRLRRALSETAIPPMVYGITPEESSSEKERTLPQTTSGTYIPMTKLTKTEIEAELPTWVGIVPACTTVEPLTQFTQTIQGNSVVTVPAMSLVSDEVKTSSLQNQIEPDFYLPGGERLSHIKTYRSAESTPEGNPAVMLKLPFLETKYNAAMFMLDKYSGNLFVADEKGLYVKIAEKGWIFPTEGMLEEPLAGNIPQQGDKTPQSLQLTSFKKTPEAESTRDPIQTSTSPRATSRTIRQIYEQKGESPFQPKPSISPKPKTVNQLLKEKRALAAVFSPELEEILKNSNTQLHLQMIEEQKQLQEIAKQKAQQAIKEQIAQRVTQRALEAEERRKAQKGYELEQQRLAEEEARIVREEQERSERDRMIAEGERLRLQAQREAAEKQEILEQKRIEAEHQARIEQQRLAEQALEELERKRKQTANQMRERQEASKTIDSDPHIEEEIGKMRNELVGPDGQIDEVKITMATAISSYPSIESLDEIPKQSLTEEQQKYYERKEQILTAKLNIAEDTYYDRKSFDSSIEEAHYFRVEYDSIKKELERKRRVCAKMLNLPIRKMPRYPTPPSVKTPPPGKLTQKQIDYYIDKDEELRLLDNKRYLAYLTGLAQAQTPEERESYIAEGLRHQEMTEALQKKIERALDSGLGEDLTQAREKLKAEGREPQTNDYLELQESAETSPTSEEREFQPKRVMKKGSPGQVGPSLLQEDMNKHIKQNLVQMGMTAYEPEERKLQNKSKKGKDL